MDWFRWHHGTVTDPKWRLVAAEAGARVGDVVSVWALMLETASQNTPRGSLAGWRDRVAAAALDLTPESVLAIRQAMEGLVLEGDRLPSWEKRQPKREREDDSTERVRAHRAREAEAVERHVTPSNALEEKRVEEKSLSVHPAGAQEEAPPEDRDLQITSLVLACNRGMGDNPKLDRYEPILPAHGRSRQVAGEWLAMGVPYEVAKEVVYHGAHEYQPSERYRQIGSLTYFDAAVKEEHVRRTAAASPAPERRFTGDRKAAPVPVGGVQGIAETAAKIAELDRPAVVRPLMAMAREEARKGAA